MDAQRRAASGKPSIASATKKRGLGSEAPGSSARGSEDRSSVAPPPPPRGTKRAREIEGIDKVRFHRFSPNFYSCCLRSAQPRRDRRQTSHLSRLEPHSINTTRLVEMHTVSSHTDSTVCPMAD